MDKREYRKMEHTYKLINREYQIYLAYRTRIIRWGLMALFTLPFLFMILMFFLKSKVVFLCLWIISFIIIAVVLAYVEYKGFYYQKLIGNGLEEPEDTSEGENL